MDAVYNKYKLQKGIMLISCCKLQFIKQILFLFFFTAIISNVENVEYLKKIIIFTFKIKFYFFNKRKLLM